ncbi:anthranilate synthase component I family protein [Ferruginibacter albus]|uniref:anthranilate synthase component I family protein n=1 Tax=Ferruginibacter albus TaxID=2875540 RepID=UPI001CC4C59C|nr:anthranilate synthase component I family protein [Ferruginibacter albus]UAY50793.1 anthranilate synthase component I family protein [Ferruginibacter albus]
MKKIEIETSVKKMLADVFTPVGIYLRLRDRFRDTILLESTDFHASENSYSFIGVNAIAGIEVKTPQLIEYKLPGQQPEKTNINNPMEVPDTLWSFMKRFDIKPSESKEAKFAQGLYGYTNYDAVQFFDTIKLHNEDVLDGVGGLRYRLYQYVIAINHFKDELFICENKIAGINSELDLLESLIKSKDVPTFPFKSNDDETSNLTNEEYVEMVKKGIASCYRGDVFQIVLSRRFQRSFTGDEFNVYRALRSINPSPYLFYFDYGDYKLMGSSPESQLIVEKGKAIVHPIAGTFKRTGDDQQDKVAAEALQKDEKENAEHVMLVDLARNDLSRMCSDVTVTQYKKTTYYSHVIHLVSEVTGTVNPGTNPFRMLAVSFPAGTLSGAPKYKAMQLIDEYENVARNYYGGAIGFIGFDGSCNHAIMIRTFLSKNNTLICQAGAGVVAASKPESELQEVNNKLNALKKAIELAQTI